MFIKCSNCGFSSLYRRCYDGVIFRGHFPEVTDTMGPPTSSRGPKYGQRPHLRPTGNLVVNNC